MELVRWKLFCYYVRNMSIYSKLIELKIKAKYQNVGSEIRIVHHVDCYEDNDFLGFVACALKFNVGCLGLEILI